MLGSPQSSLQVFLKGSSRIAWTLWYVSQGLMNKTFLAREFTMEAILVPLCVEVVTNERYLQSQLSPVGAVVELELFHTSWVASAARAVDGSLYLNSTLLRAEKRVESAPETLLPKFL